MSATDGWPESFRRDRGRAPRVLHIGNIANNAYLNARMLNEAGVDSDVLCYGNYHFMASPEWEELDQIDAAVDPDRPDWDAIAPGRFKRPRWFAQGAFGDATRYLEARRTGAGWRAGLGWAVLETRRQLVCSGRWRALRQWRDRLREQRPSAQEHSDPSGTAASLASDVAAYHHIRAWTAARLTSLCSHYDVVHAYGAEPILPFAAGVRPYVAWEHGTLRHLPFQPTVEGRLVAHAYREADVVVITNADNRAAADRIGITRYQFVPHPVNEVRPDAGSVAALRARLRQELAADFLVFHPSRQHWSEQRHPHFEKGNDRLIRGLAQFLRARPRAAAVFVDWGQSVPASRDLIAELGIADRIHWIAPQPGVSLARHMMACEVTADQFFLGSFGSTMPRALWLECAALIHLDEAAHRWCLPVSPPVINASAPEQIAAGLARAYDEPHWRVGLAQAGRRWYEAHHSSEVLLRSLLQLYAGLVPGN